MRNERKAISRIRKGGRCVNQDGDPSEDGSSRSLGASSTAQKRRVPSRAADTAWFACGKYATAVTTSWCAWTCGEKRKFRKNTLYFYVPLLPELQSRRSRRTTTW